jgi:hypothetical protein
MKIMCYTRKRTIFSAILDIYIYIYIYIIAYLNPTVGITAKAVIKNCTTL